MASPGANRVCTTLGCALVLLLPAASRDARAQELSRFGLTFEGASVWASRIDVRIPPDTGTEFSISDLIGSGPAAAVRVEGTVELNRRNGLRFAYAPLRISGTGVPAAPIVFTDVLFDTVPTQADYEFNSFRATWRYRFYDGTTWQWNVGFTGFVRDARIALEQTGAAAEDTDVGFVPLAHLSGEATLSPRWRVQLELDGSAASQGRAIDALAALEYRPTPQVTISAGYRTIEGGADVDEVYTFAWLHALVARVGVGF